MDYGAKDAPNPPYILISHQRLIKAIVSVCNIGYLFFQEKHGALGVTTNQNTLPDLEASLAEIANLIDKMEHSNLTLEQSLSNFERGVMLVKHCQKILENAEQKVQLLIQNNQREELVPFDTTHEGQPGNEDHNA